MNVQDFIKNIQKKPAAYVHEIRADYLEYVIEGFICCNSMYDRVDEEERYFHCYFVDWIGRIRKGVYSVTGYRILSGYDSRFAVCNAGRS